jgi:hypothetical protein
MAQPGNLAVTSICQTDNGDIYVGTGEGNLYYNGPAGSKGGGVLGGGIFKSTDGDDFSDQVKAPGAPNTWGTDFAHINRLAAVGNTVYAATNRGLHYSDDGGASWNNCFSSGPEMTQVSIDVKSVGSTVLAVINNLVYSTTSGPTNFSKISGIGGLPTNANVDRAEVAINSADANYMYVAYANGNGAMGGVYMSSDGGVNWTQIGFSGSSSFQPYSNASQNQGGFNNMIGTVPGDPTRLILGGVQLWEYRNGSWIRTGSEFQSPFNPFYVHPDKHSITFHPDYANGTRTILIGSDGGVTRSTNGGETWSSVNRGYNTLQFYTVDYQATAAGEVVGGAQDNSIQFIDYQGNTPMTAEERLSGDGTYVGISKFSADYHIYSAQFGRIVRSNDGGESFSATSSFLSPRMLNEDFGFFTPAVVWEKIEGSVYDNANFTDTAFVMGAYGGVWMTRGVWDYQSLPDWWKVLDISAAQEVTAVSISSDGDVLYAGTGSGAVYMVENLLMARDSATGSDEGAPLTSVTVLNVGSGGQDVSEIAINPNNSHEVLVTLSLYGASSNIKYCANTAASSPSWSSKDGNLPDGPIYTALMEFGNTDRVIIGNDFGVWVTEDISAANPMWERQTDIPMVATHMIRQQTRRGSGVGDGRIYVGTHGRGFWRSSSFVSVEEEVAEVKDLMNVYPNPATDVVNIDLGIDYNQPLTIAIYDIQGKVVASTETNANGGTVRMDVSAIATGNYVVRVTGEGVSQAERLIIQ